METMMMHRIHLAVELVPGEAPRLPEPATRNMLGVEVPFLRVPPPPHTTAASLMLFAEALFYRRVLPTDWRP
jgi:hypothetical protein